MARKKVTVSLPADVLAALDARAKAIGFPRGKFLADLLEGASGLMDEMLSTEASASVPITIGFSPEAIRDYGRAAAILNTTPQGLISRTLEVGRKTSIETAREFERKQILLEDTKVH